MHMDKRVDNGVTVIEPLESREVDVSSVDDFQTSVLDAAGDATRVVLDLSAIQFFDSSGMSGLLSIKNAIGDRGGHLVLAGLNKDITHMFQIIGFDVVFHTFPDTVAAVSSFGEPASDV